MSVESTTTKYGLTVGTPKIDSVGPLAFGPDGILFVADNINATISAILVEDEHGPTTRETLSVDTLDTKLASFLGCSKDEVFIKDMALHPVSENPYLSIVRGTGQDALPVLVKIGPNAVLSEVGIERVPFSQTSIDNAPTQDDNRTDVRVVQGDREGELIPAYGIRVARDQLRTITVTDMSYVDGLLLVAGASNEEFASTLRRIPFPFKGDNRTNSLEIYHVIHGKYETASPIRTLVPYGGNSNVLASYTCTPVVQFSLSDLKSGEHIKGKTVADLGGGNTPLDMISFQQEDKEFLLVSNSIHPLMKIACSDIDAQEPLTQPKEPLGVPRKTLPQKGVSHMVNQNGSHVLMIQQDDDGSLGLRSYSTATL